MRKFSRIICSLTYAWLVLAGVLPLPALGALRYADKQANGANDGTSWADAFEELDQVTGLSAGDTLYVSGGDPNTVYETQLTINTAGTQENPITVATGALAPSPAGHDGPVFITGGPSGIRLNNGAAWITIDGDDGNSNINLILECPVGMGVYGASSSVNTGIVVGYCKMQYCGNAAGHGGVNLLGCSGPGNRIHHCIIHHSYQDLIHFSGGKTGDPGAVKYLEIDNNLLMYPSDDVMEGSTSGLYVHHNDIGRMDDYYDPDANFHPDVFQSYSYQGVYFYANYIHDWNYGERGVQGVFLNPYQAGDVANVFMFNNIIECSGEKTSYTVGLFGTGGFTTLNNVYFLNNTIWGAYFTSKFSFGDLAPENCSNIYIENNLWHNCDLMHASSRYPVQFGDLGMLTLGGHADDVDIHFDFNQVGDTSETTILGPDSSTAWDAWVAATGCQDHDQDSPEGENIVFNTAAEAPGHLGPASTDTILRDAGADWSSLFTTDYFGNERDSNFDVGAIEYISGDPTPREFPDTADYVQAGWLDVTQAADGQNLTGGNGEYWLEACDTVNNMIGRDGTIYGARIKLNSYYSHIAGLGFLVLRPNGTKYDIVGKAPTTQEGPYIASELAVGVNSLGFLTPIEHVRSTDYLAVMIHGDTTWVWKALNASDTLPVNDSSTAVFHYYDLNSTSYDAAEVGDSLTLSTSASYAVLPLAALMEKPVVMIAGDSISEGSTHNFSHRRNIGDKGDRDEDGAYVQIACRQLGWGCEIGGNMQGSNNLLEVINNDLTEGFWSKSPTAYLLVHCGINDIYDGAPHDDWETMRSRLETIRADCRSHGVKLILTSIFPCGDLDETKSQKRDALNASRKTWAAQYSDVIYFDLNAVLGTYRDGGDAGNLWDIWSPYAINPGVDETHLSKTGAATVGGALAAFLRAYEISAERTEYLNLIKDRLRYIPIETIRVWEFESN